MKKFLQIKQKKILIENELKKSYRRLTPVFLLIKATLVMIDHKILIVQPIYKTLTTFSGLMNTIAEWESKGLSNEKIKSLFTANHSLSPKLVWMNNSRI